MSRRLLALFAKAPRPGDVKTRLQPLLRPDQSAAFYDAMLRDIVAMHATSADDRALWYTPESERAWFGRLVAGAYRLLPQHGPDLGARMARLFRTHAAAGHERIVLRGTDSPTLPPERVEEAFLALDSADLVICPDRDGGYNLVGLRAPADALFDLPMSESSVLERTLARAAELGLRAELLAPHHDVDTPEDLEGLREELRSEAVRRRASRTARWLDAAFAGGLSPRLKARNSQND